MLIVLYEILDFKTNSPVNVKITYRGNASETKTQHSEMLNTDAIIDYKILGEVYEEDQNERIARSKATQESSKKERQTIQQSET